MKSADRKRRGSGGLFPLLARSYLLFTVVLLAIAGGVYGLWYWRYNALFEPVDAAGLASDAAFLDNRFSKALGAQYLSDWGQYAVLDEKGALLFASAEDFPVPATPGELACIPLQDGSEYVSVYRYDDPDGNARILLVFARYSADGSLPAENRVVILDDRYRVVSGIAEEGRSAYTEQEFKYLTGEWSQTDLLTRLPCVDASGHARTLLIRTGSFNLDAYNRKAVAVGRIWLAVIPLFILSAGFFLWRLDKRLRRPLQTLDEAIVALGEGASVQASACGGPKEIRQLGRNFDEMAEKLAQSERQRQELHEGRQKLIADISHDLKTPITVIAGYARAIRDGKVPPEELNRHLEVIETKSAALSDLIGTFFEYSRTEHPEFRLELAQTDLCEYLRAYLAEKYDEIDLAGFELRVSIPETQILARLDAVQFRRVLDNLLANALRHSALGTLIQVRLRLLQGEVSIRIADNGEGVPPALRERLFEPFAVGDESRSGKGSGLGLAAAKRIVEAHGGTIRLLPELDGQGAEFEILLPA